MAGKKINRSLRKTTPSTRWLWGVGLIIPILGVVVGLFNQFVHQIHDLNTFLWSRAVYELMLKGVWYPHWLPQLWYGFGLPVLYFYPPLFYLVAGGLQIIGLPTVLAIKVILIISAVMGGVFAYLWAREWMSKPAAFLTMGIWLWSPYYLSLIYTRGAFPEFMALNLIPMLLWFTTRTWREAKWQYWLGTMVSFLLIILTHNLTIVVATVVWLAYLLHLFIAQRNHVALLHQGMALIAAGLTAGFYWVPMLAYRQVINTQLLTSGDFYYGRNFPELSQLINLTLNPVISWLTLGLGLTIILVLGWLIQSEIFDQQLRYRLRFYLVMASGFLLLVIPYTSFIWGWIPGIELFQFPIRFLGIIGLLLAMVAGLIVESFVQDTPARWRIGLGGLVVVGVLAIPFATPRFIGDAGQIGLNSSNFNIFNYMESVVQKAAGNDGNTTVSFDRGAVSYEYLPRQLTEDESLNLYLKTLSQFRSDDTTNSNKMLRVPELVEASLPSTNIETVVSTPTHSRFVITNSQAEILAINQFEFPTWRFSLNGAVVNPKIDLMRSGQTLQLPIGRNVLEIKLVQTAPMYWGQAISWIGVGLAAIWWLKLRRPDLTRGKRKRSV